MKNVLLGKSGLKVSELSLGTMTFGRETDEKESNIILQKYLDAGGNFIDTANGYADGKSEEILGRALKGKREEVVLATKVFFRKGPGVNDYSSSRKHILKAVRDSLHRLQTDYIDLYQLHCWDLSTPIEETLETLDSLVNQGVVRYVGVSNYSGWQIMKSLWVSQGQGFTRMVSAQMEYSLVVRDIEMEVVPACQAEGVSIMAWGPLGGGFLSGKYQSGEFPKEGRLSIAKKEWEESWDRRATEKNFSILKVLEDLAKKHQKTIAQLALNWLLSKENVIPILGVRTIQQFEDNIGSVNWTLSPEDVKRLDEVSNPESRYPYRFIQWANSIVRA
ncbi:MAG: aldo/keto reductase [Candidatus Atribacteria bacterium]|nr:aldo/keto reductase [Candidatus Atribacteria bacterium]